MKKALSIIVAFIMLLSTFGFAPNEQTQDNREQQAVQVKTVDELRETNSDTYLLSDGSYECVVYSEDKYYKNTRGEYVEIDNTIIRSKRSDTWGEYAYRNASSDTVFAFSATKPSVLIEANDRAISFTINNSRESTAIPGGIEKYSALFDYPINGNNSIAYIDALKSTDIVYTAANGTLKELIILKDASAASMFTFSFKTDGLIARKVKDGTVEFVDERGENVFELSPLFAIDAAGAYTDELNYSIVYADESSVEITVELSAEFINDSNRAFPILIDPSVMVTGASVTYDSFVSSAKPNTNYRMSTALRTGKDEPYGVRRTYIKFDIPSSVIGNITSSYIRLKKDSGAAPNVRAYRVLSDWSSSTITWNNKPSFTYAQPSTLSTYLSDDWYKLVTTDIVSGWISGTNTNHGFMLKDSNESSTSQWTTFYSSEALSPNKPELHITYTKASFTMYSYLDNGFVTRFPNGVQSVNSYHETVKPILEAIFPELDVEYCVYTFTSYCDICKDQIYGSGNWGSEDLTAGCPHTQQHLSVNPGFNQMDKNKGFYFDFVRRKGVGTETLTKYFWTGHIPEPSTQSSFSVQYYEDAYISKTLHSIVCIMPRFVTQGAGFENRPQSVVKREYEFELLHETSHQLGAPDHYCSSPNNQPCNNPYCWECNSDLVAASCVMRFRYDLEDLNNNTMYCPQCIAMIRAHLLDHHY